MLPLDKLRRVLVVRTDHIGDLIVSTPFLRALRQGMPQAYILAMVPKAAREVLGGNDLVQEILSPDDPLPQGLDLAIALAPRTRAYRLVHSSQARYRVGYVYPERLLTRLMCQVWLTHRLKMEVRSQLRRGQPVPHEIEQLGRLAGYLGLDYGEPRLELPVGAQDQDFGQQQARDAVGLHLSEGWLTWGWQLEDFVDLARALPPPVVVTYGPAEAHLAETLKRWDPGLTLLGGLGLKRWAGVLEACRCVVSTDTGAVHVAAARGRPVVVAFQPQQFELCSQQWHPWGVPHRGLPKGSPEETRPQLVAAVEELLSDPRKGPS